MSFKRTLSKQLNQFYGSSIKDIIANQIITNLQVSKLRDIYQSAYVYSDENIKKNIQKLKQSELVKIDRFKARLNYKIIILDQLTKRPSIWHQRGFIINVLYSHDNDNLKHLSLQLSNEVFSSSLEQLYPGGKSFHRHLRPVVKSHRKLSFMKEFHCNQRNHRLIIYTPMG